MQNSVINKTYKNSGNSLVINSIYNSAKTILDIGCGAGDNAEILKSMGRVIDGITLSEDEAKLAISSCRNVFIHNLENGLPEEIFNNKYDVIICSHVLEHICWPDQLLNDIKKVMNHKSEVVIVLPNIMHYNSRIQLIKGKFEYTDTGIMDRTHFRWYTYSSGKRLLLDNGFNVKYASVDIALPFYRISKFMPNILQKIIKNCLRKLSPGFFGSQLLYIAVLS